MTHTHSDADSVLERSRADRGARALIELGEPPDTGSTAAVFAEIPNRLGAAVVPPIFKALAHWPEFLTSAWNSYAPLIDTPEYLAAREQMRVPDVLLFDATVTADDGLTAYLRLQQALLPDLLLLATAWYRSGCGLGSRHLTRSGGSPRGTAVAPPAGPADPDERLMQQLAAAHDQPRVPSVYRAIGAWPDFLEQAAPGLLSRIESSQYQSAKGQLLADVITAADDLAMPAVDTNGDDGPLEILALFRTRMIPPLLFDTAILLSLIDTTRKDDPS